jgi:hypothetical protein
MSFKSNRSAQDNETTFSIGQQLRSVGQGFDSLDVEDFDLKAEDDGYFALGMSRAPSAAGDERSDSKQTVVINTVQDAWHNLTKWVTNNGKGSVSAPKVLRILFTREGIDRLQREGKAKRSEDSAGIPNFTKLAQILRMVGERIDSKSGRLLKACKRQDRISFEYETASDGRITEEWKLSELYETWLSISNQRQERYDIGARELDCEREEPSTEPNR